MIIFVLSTIFQATIPHIPMWENQETEPAEPTDEPEEEALWENPLVMFCFVFFGAFSINNGKLATKILGYNPEMMLKTTRPKARRKRRRSPKRARPWASTRSLPRNIRKDCPERLRKSLAFNKVPTFRDTINIHQRYNWESIMLRAAVSQVLEHTRYHLYSE